MSSEPGNNLNMAAESVANHRILPINLRRSDVPVAKLIIAIASLINQDPQLSL